MQLKKKKICDPFSREKTINRCQQSDYLDVKTSRESMLPLLHDRKGNYLNYLCHMIGREGYLKLLKRLEFLAEKWKL